MAEHPRQLQVDQDLAFQRREWTIQRLGWWALVAFVAAAALGLFGKGPLSGAQAGTPGGPLWVDYDRFVRAGSGTRLVVNRGDGQPDTGFVLRINRRYFDRIRVERIAPEPASMTVGAADVELRFDPATAAPFSIVLDIEPLRSGRAAARFTTDGGDTVAFTQFAFF